MAVDSAAKRFGMLNMRSPIRKPLFIPDGTVDAIDRAHLLSRYGGNPFIAALPPHPRRIIVESGRDRVIVESGSTRTITVN